MKLEVKKIGINGEGIAYFKRKPVFIKGAIPQEIVEVKNIKDMGRYFTAAISRIIKRSRYRKEVACPYYGRCGACQMLHIDYKEQCQYKKAIVKESLLKYASVESDIVSDTIACDEIFAYRNSLKMPICEKRGKLITGLYASDSNHLIEVDRCLMHDAKLDRVRKNILNVLNKYHLKGIEGIYLRALGEEIQGALIGKDVFLSKTCLNDLEKIEGLVSLYSFAKHKKPGEFLRGDGKLLFGRKTLEFSFMGLKIDLSIKSFFQLNTHQAEKLYALATSFIKEGDIVFEGYCGIGIMSSLVAKKAKKVIASEIVKEAIADAKKIALKNDIRNVRFICGDSPSVFEDYKDDISVLLIDPPRSGLDEKMLQAIKNSKVERIIYISCNSSTLAKDIGVLKRCYELKKVIPLDMFANSAHVETVALLSYKS